MNDRHRTILRWYKRHKNKSMTETFKVIDLILMEIDLQKKKLLAERIRR